MADDIVNLSLDKINVESTSTSIVREYLARKGLKETLKKLDEECPRDEKSLNSRSKIIEYLKINKLYEANKKLKEPYSAVLEVIMSYLVTNDISNKSHSVNYKPILVQEKSVDIKKMGNKQSANDIRVDDAEDGELTDGTEKRFKNEEKEVVTNNKRIPNTTTAKKPITKESEKKSIKKPNETSEINNKNDFLSDELFKTKLTDDNSNKSKKSYNDLFGTTNTNDTDNNEELDDFDKLLKEKAQRLKGHNTEKTDEPKVEQVIKKPEATENKIKTLKFTNDNNNNNNNDNNNVPLILPNNSNNNALQNNSSIKKDYQITPMDYQTAVTLKTLIFGNPNVIFNDEWKYQSFQFCDYVKLKYGLVQKKGGPCGVLASVQAHILLELLFSNEANGTVASFDVNKRERSKVLAIAIAKLLWKCGEEDNHAFVCITTNKAHFAPVGKYRSDGITETINLLEFISYKSLEEYLIKNISIFENEENYGVILLLYSAIFSRGIKNIQADMDEPTNKLMGQHFYCTQEMVNLLIHGKAYSNVFNDTMYVDSLKLRGPDKRNDIGLLSLFEHYKSCEVGSFYKTPKYPIWVICSESHFSVMFSLKKEILSDWKAENKFDLYYYDGLARQDEQIRLTIDCSNHNMFGRSRNRAKKDLVPPLELVIQTKWKDAVIDWNGYEPIL